MLRPGGQRDGYVGKALVAQWWMTDYLYLIPQNTCNLGGRRLHKVIFWLLQAYSDTHAHIHTSCTQIIKATVTKLV